LSMIRIFPRPPTKRKINSQWNLGSPNTLPRKKECHYYMQGPCKRS